MKFEYDLTIVIPCFNEAPHLKESVTEIMKVLDKTRYSYEILLIDDFSQDDTVLIIKELSSKLNNVNYLLNQTNHGRGYTVKKGILEAKGRVAGFLDIDLEVGAYYIPEFVSVILDDGYDMSLGYRFYRFNFSMNSLLRNILSVIYRKIVWYMLKMPFKDTESGYKFFDMTTSRHSIEETISAKWFWDTEVVCRLFDNGCKIKEIPVVFIRNADKKSTVRLFSDCTHYLRDIYRFKKRGRNVSSHAPMDVSVEMFMKYDKE